MLETGGVIKKSRKAFTHFSHHLQYVAWCRKTWQVIIPSIFIWVSPPAIQKIQTVLIFSGWGRAYPTCLPEKKNIWAMNKKKPSCLGYMGDYTEQLNHHKDPYQTTSISWKVRDPVFFFRGSLGDSNRGKVRRFLRHCCGSWDRAARVTKRWTLR